MKPPWSRSRVQRADGPPFAAGCCAAQVSRTQGPPEDIRRRVAGWRAAELRERQVRREEPILEPTTALEREKGRLVRGNVILAIFAASPTGIETLLNSGNADKSAQLRLSLVA